MFEEYTLESQLNNIVYKKVVRDPYPVPTPLIDDSVQRNELSDLKAERIQRPPTKQEYLDLLDSLTTQISDIAAQNATITLNNAAARKAVDDKYTADIATAKLDQVNIGAALCNCINYQLNQTEWYVVKDNGLTDAQQVKADAWRTAQMNIVYEEPTIGAAVAKYDTLLTTKPKYDLAWEAKEKAL